MEKSIELIDFLLGKGRLFEARNALEDALPGEPENLRLRQLLGLTLARLGLLDDAAVQMETLARTHEDPETLGILGRVYKDFWKRTGDETYLHRSREVYSRAFEKTMDPYNGINAATLSQLAGQNGEAIRLARATIETASSMRVGYWKHATLGEAYLLVGELDQAREHYARACELGKGDAGSLHSTLAQIRLLASALPDAAPLVELFPDTTVVAFAGHMLDGPGRAEPRFPPYAEGPVRVEIRTHLAEMKADIGYTGLACGSDILFAEAMIERGAELNVVLPFRREDFLPVSVEFAGGNWSERFHRMLASAQSVRYTTEESYNGEDFLFNLCANQILGLSILRASLFSTTPRLLTVWDTLPGKSGGTAETVALFPWPGRHRSVDLRRFIRAGELSTGPAASQAEMPAASPFKRELKFILFSDVKGFSKLDEGSTPLFLLHFLRAISARITDFEPKPTVLNTWGDAIFALMEDPVSIAEYALELQEAVLRTDWTSIGLPQLSMRIALHAGPVFMARDPLVQRLNAYGSHVNRAARMEPVTAPGSVFVSEQFAAALVLKERERYRLEYAGLLTLPKSSGDQEMFRLRRAP